MFASTKVWTVLLGGLATAGASWLAKYQLEVSDAAIQQIAATCALLVGILVHAQGQADAGKEAAKINAAAGVPVTPQAPQPAPSPAPTIVAMLAVLVMGTSQVACPNPGPVGPAINVAVDCLGSNRGAIDNLLNEFRPLIVGGSVRWADVYQRGKQAGREIGTCFVLELAQLYLSGTRAPADAREAYDTAERFRVEVAGGAVAKTICTKPDGTKQACSL